jgi:hypothetical protein
MPLRITILVKEFEGGPIAAIWRLYLPKTMVPAGPHPMNFQLWTAIFIDYYLENTQ